MRGARGHMWGSIQFSGRLENPSRRIIGYILYCIQNLINTRSKSTCQIESWAEIIILRHEDLIRQFTNGPGRPVYVTSLNVYLHLRTCLQRCFGVRCSMVFPMHIFSPFWRDCRICGCQYRAYDIRTIFVHESHV